MRHPILLGIILSALPALAACGSDHAPTKDAALPDRLVPPDRRVPWECVSPPDALPDSLPDRPDSWDATRPQGIHYDFCDQPIWQIPHEDSVRRDIYFDTINGTDLFYRVHTSARPPTDDVYYFDISTCTEYHLNDIAPPGIHLVGSYGAGPGRVIVVGWDDGWETKYQILVDLETWNVGVLIADQPGSFVNNAQSNGTVLASFFSAVRNQGPFDLQILDLETNDATSVWSGPLAYSYMAVTDSFVLFEPVDHDPSCTSMAITHFVDLDDLSQGDIPDTCVKSQHRFIGSGRRIGYMEAQGMLPAPYTCVVMDMDTDQKWVLTQDDQSHCFGGMDGHLVFWTTARYGTSGQMTDLIGDLMVTDLDRNTERRLTSQATYGFIAHPIALPWAVFFIPRGNYYVFNLQALGVVDQDGHLIEGPPIDEITQLGLQ